MNLKEYQKQTIRTFAFRKSELTTTMTDMLHCAIGCSTEAGELIEAYNNKDLINMSEEIADQMWYLSNLSNFIKLDLYNEVNLISKNHYESRTYYIERSAILSANLLDIFKKVIFYNKELDVEKLKNQIIEMIQNLKDSCGIFGFDLNKLLDNNINKLRVRFPDKFTDELAENRDLDKERKELEK